MAAVRIYHNPNCSKSRGALAILRERGVETEVVEYLAQPPTRQQLERILDGVALPPGELVRHDQRFRELGLEPEACTTRDAVIELLLAHPELLQRPVVVRGERAVVGRPPETVLDLLDDA